MVRIAIFGSNEPKRGELPAAELLARAIARRGAIVLTGGSWKEGPKLIKDVAIVAAEKTSTSTHLPVWIGVANEASPAAPRHEHRGVILTPGGGHERNFVEACLCHAAVALGGSDGTSSEALFSLYLGRPTALVNFPGSPPPQETISALKVAAKNRVNPPEDQDPVRQGIRGAYQWAAPDGSVWHETLPSTDAGADAIIERLIAEINQVDKINQVDEWARPGNAEAWRAFAADAIVRAGR